MVVLRTRSTSALALLFVYYQIQYFYGKGFPTEYQKIAYGRIQLVAILWSANNISVWFLYKVKITESVIWS